MREKMITKHPAPRIDSLQDHAEVLRKGSQCRARFFCLRCYGPLETVRT
jgi:hypothetical protein